MMAKVLLERRYQPVSEEMLLKAFQVLTSLQRNL